jgi:predicted protein tyrosine phosphatase
MASALGRCNGPAEDATASGVARLTHLPAPAHVMIGSACRRDDDKTVSDVKDHDGKMKECPNGHRDDVRAGGGAGGGDDDNEYDGEGGLDSAVSTDPTEDSGVHLVAPNLYLSGIPGASELWRLKALFIRHIINCSDQANIFADDDDARARRFPFSYTRIVVNDVPQDAAKLAAHFDSVSDLISTAVGKGNAVLVHCTQGASRSVSLVLAYLMKHHRMSLDDALDLVRSKRNCALPNAGFIQALKTFGDKQTA